MSAAPATYEVAFTTVVVTDPAGCDHYMYKGNHVTADQVRESDLASLVELGLLTPCEEQQPVTGDEPTTPTESDTPDPAPKRGKRAAAKDGDQDAA